MLRSTLLIPEIDVGEYYDIIYAFDDESLQEKNSYYKMVSTIQDFRTEPKKSN